MKTISLVILFMALAAFAKSNSQATISDWPKAITQTVHNKTLKAVCETKTFCTDISAKDLNDPTLFKLSSVNNSTLLITYKNVLVSVQHDSQKALYKVNQKALDLRQVQNVTELKEQILEKLPGEKQAQRGFNWFNYAEAELASPAQFQIMLAITRLILATEENDICQQTVTIAAQCSQFGKETAAILDSVNKAPTQSVADSMTDSVNKQKTLLKSMYEISSMMSHLDLQMSSISPAKKEAAERCECQGGTCKLANKSDQPTALGLQFKTCLADAKKLRTSLPATADLQQQLDKIEEFFDKTRTVENSATAPTEQGFTKNSNGR